VSRGGGITLLESPDPDGLLNRAADGDETAWTELFTIYRKPLKRMVRLRLNRLLQSRVDDSNILQEALLEAARRWPDYLANQGLFARS
jgi:RNA polymerase sigma-70 factor (ECF subfamily)